MSNLYHSILIPLPVTASYPDRCRIEGILDLLGGSEEEFAAEDVGLGHVFGFGLRLGAHLSPDVAKSGDFNNVTFQHPGGDDTAKSFLRLTQRCFGDAASLAGVSDNLLSTQGAVVIHLHHIHLLALVRAELDGGLFGGQVEGHNFGGEIVKSLLLQFVNLVYYLLFLGFNLLIIWKLSH